MSIAIATFNLANYKELADITDSTKIEYCQRHGYKFFALRNACYSHRLGFNKIHYTLDIFKRFPDVEWLLFSECDAMITNLKIRIEDKIDDSFHFIVPIDAYNINSGNFLARNTKEGREYLQMIIDSELAYRGQWQGEQQVIIDTYKNYPNVVKLVEQRYMNSYELELYPEDIKHLQGKDMLGNPAQWEQGDWIVHWAGKSLQARLQRARELTKLIVR